MCAPSTRRRAKSAARRYRRRPVSERQLHHRSRRGAAAAAAVGSAAREMGAMRHAVGATNALSRGARERNDSPSSPHSVQHLVVPERR